MPQVAKVATVTGSSPEGTLDLRFELQPLGDGSRTLVVLAERLDGLLPRLLSEMIMSCLSPSVRSIARHSSNNTCAFV